MPFGYCTLPTKKLRVPLTFFKEEMMTTDPVPRVIATDSAQAFLATLKEKYGPLMFFQSGGCCDGSSPLCYAQGEFPVSDDDVYLGSLDGTPFFMGHDQFAYWKHTQLIIDVIAGMGGMFSLDNGTGKRFLTRSRLFTDEENVTLDTTVLTRP
jgi:uncharacterized protein (DUF779 family)